MKRCCKNVDITDLGLIMRAVLNCFSTSKKRRRGDTQKLFQRYLSKLYNLPESEQVSISKTRRILANRSEDYIGACALIAADVQKQLQTEQYELTPVVQEIRKDPGSGKERKISILGIMQLILDHVAVLGLEELSKRIGITQVSSIKNKGAHFGKAFITKWMHDKKRCKYHVKLDVKDFYGSLDKEFLYHWLAKRVKNARLLNLIKTLINTIDLGLPIGSFLSQTLANIYLADIWHYAKEKCRFKRKSRRNNTIEWFPQVTQSLFYMDDMLFLGPNKRELTKAIKSLVEFAKNNLKLTIKPNWQVHKVCRNTPIDIMGFRFDGKVVTLRKRIFRLARRIFLRIKHRGSKYISIMQASRAASYWGYFKHTATKTVLSKLNAIKSFQRITSVISSYAS